MSGFSGLPDGGPVMTWLRAFVWLVREVGFPVLVSVYLLWELGPKVDRLVLGQSELREAVYRMLEHEPALVRPGPSSSSGRVVAPVVSVVGSVAPRDSMLRTFESCALPADGAWRSLGLRCAE